VKRVFLALVIVLGVAFAAGVYLIIARSDEPYKGYTAAEQFVEVPPGASPNTIGRRLAAAGVVRDLATFRYVLARSGQERRLKAGEYRFDRPLRPREVIDMLARGAVYLRPLTFREGLSIRQMAGIYEQAGFGPASEFTSAATNVSLINDLDPDARDLEGYLFPNTYSLPRRATASQLIDQMVGAFRAALTDDVKAGAAARGLSVRELVTLASIVEKETGKPDERPMVAAVYSNRLRIGMGLQCDPTVIYALERAGRYTGNLTREDLRFDSPYNTYRYAGLPPGPIASPGRASLEASALPADVPFIYFVSRNDGSHAFASTLAEHNRNVLEYQIKPFRKSGGSSP
jgi:UPF0755 protein